MKRSLLALAAFLPGLANAQELSGQASAVDGDTLNMTGIAIRLHGIDAPEARQTCRRDDTTWNCGQEAAQMLSRLVAGKGVQCQQRDIDAFGRIVATCRVGQIDLADALVRAGYAVALPQYSDAYLESEEKARTLKAGIWSSKFEAPADYRAAHATPSRFVARPGARSMEGRAMPSTVSVVLSQLR